MLTATSVEAEMPYGARAIPRTLYELLTFAVETHASRPALSFQILSDPGAPSETLTWRELHGRTTQAANLFRRLGVGPGDTVGLPSAQLLGRRWPCSWGGAVAGIVNPINPLLGGRADCRDPARDAREGARDAAQLSQERTWHRRRPAAVKFAPNVKTVLEVDLLR